MDIDTLRKLHLLGPHLNALTLQDAADCFYDLLAGALVWEDEIPDLTILPPELPEALRGVLRYRTTVILGEPDYHYQAIWSEAQRLFPNWPGFAPARLSSDLRPKCKELMSKARKEMNEIFDD